VIQRAVVGLAFAVIVAACGGSTPSASITSEPASTTPEVVPTTVPTPAATLGAPQPVLITTTIAPLSPIELCGSLGGCLPRLTLLRTNSDTYLERYGLERYVGSDRPEYVMETVPFTAFGDLLPGLYLLVGTLQPVSDIIGGPDGPFLGSGRSCSATFAVGTQGGPTVHIDFGRAGCTIEVGE
jgi:hypothetical protein